MAKSSKDALGAVGGRDLWLFEPEKLHLVTDKSHPLYDERVDLPVDEALVANIMFEDTGVIEPIVIAKDPETGKIDVVDGRQRVKACVEANKRRKKQGLEPFQIAGIPKRGQAHVLAGLMASTFIRQDDSPLGRAKKISRYIALGRTDEQAANQFGISVATVKNLVRVLDAPAAVRQAFEHGQDLDERRLQGGEDGAGGREEGGREARHRGAQDSREEALEERAEGARDRHGGEGADEARMAQRATVLGEDALRARNQLENVKAELAELPENEFRRGAIAAFSWMLGNDEALALLVGA